MKQNRKWFRKIKIWSLLVITAAGMLRPEYAKAKESGEPAEVKVQEEAGEQMRQAGTSQASPGIEGEAERALSTIRLTVGNGQTTPEYQAGQEGIRLEVKVANQGNAGAQNVRISPIIENPADWPFEVAEWNYEQNLGTIEPGKTQTAAYENLKVRSDVETKTWSLQFQVVCDDGTKECDPVIKTVYVKTTEMPKEETPQEEAPQGEVPQDTSGAGEMAVFNSEPVAVGGETSGASVPRVIVAGFSTEPGEVHAGNNFRLIIHIKNTSTKTAVSNMLFDLQATASGTEAAAEAPAFLPASGGSSIYLDRIPAGGTKDISIDLNARADLIQKPYNVDVSMKYEDSNATQYESTSSLAVPVKQEARFEFSDVELSPASIQVGEEANVVCSLYNTGRTKLYNVKARFEGKGISAQEVFVGNVDSGATGTIDGMLTGEEEISAGTKCKMIVSYEDESGNAATVEEEFEIEVLPAVEEDMSAMMEEVPEDPGMPIFPIVIVIIVVAVIAAVVIRNRKNRKKKALMIEEDLFDEVDRFTEDE